MSQRALLKVWRLSLATRCRRLCEQARLHTALSLALIFVSAASLVALVALARSPASRGALDWLAHNAFLVGLAAALYALPFVFRQRAHWKAEHSQSWLIAAPIPGRAFKSIAAMRVVVALVGHALVVIAVLALVGVAHGYAIADLSSVIAGLAIGTGVGGGLGGVWPQKAGAIRHEDSRFVRKARATSAGPSLDGLSRWPIARAVAWHRPENSRVLFIVAALSVPVGTPAILGIAILAVWTLGSYLFAIVRAVPSIAREAAIWLRPTPLPFASFAWAIGRRALLHQLIGTTLLSALFLFLGGALASVACFATLWMAVTVMIGVIGLRQSFLSLPSSGRTLLSVLLVLAAESRGRGWGVPLAALLTVVHMRGGVRGRA